MRKILHNNEIICIVANLEDAKEGLDFLSEDNDFIQVGTWNYKNLYIFKILEDAVVLEVKNGPYFGPEKDRTRIEKK